MNSRERLLAVLSGEIPDRVPYHESFWTETATSWHKEGLPDETSPDDYFGTEIRHIGFDAQIGLPEEVLEETDEYKVWIDRNGVTRKDFKGESGHTPQWIDHRVKTRKDWEKVKGLLVPSRERITMGGKMEDVLEPLRKWRQEGKFICFTVADPYECAWPVLGQVGIFTAMLDEPKWVADMFRTFADYIIGMAEIFVKERIDFDGVWLWGDVGYRNGLLFSPEIYRALLWPQEKQICDFFRSIDKPVILHSCGKIESLIPDFITAGFSAIQPLEAKVGQDVRKLKGIFGERITLFGNIDVRKLSGSKSDVEEEVISKLLVAKEGGRYIFHSDHSVPPTVPFENYTYALKLLREYGNY